MSKITYTATTPAGDTFTRSSATMAYTHALVLAGPETGIVASWHKTEAAAAKAAARYRNLYTDGIRPIVTEVQALEYNSPEAKAARAADPDKVK